MPRNPRVILIKGATAVGKTAWAIEMAKRLRCPIVSADSRQIYKGMPIGTAAPSRKEQGEIPHYMVGCISVLEDYSVAHYRDALLDLLKFLFRSYESVLIVGGSMLYLSAIENGIDRIPSVSPLVRENILHRLQVEGEERLSNELRLVDPIYYRTIDPSNTQRVLHALEVYYTTGQPFSSFHSGEKKTLPYQMYKLYLELPRETLYERINQRTEKMLLRGWLMEALTLYPYRHRNALNTIGYKEIFAFFDEILSQQKKEANDNPTKLILPLIKTIEKGTLPRDYPEWDILYRAMVEKIKSSTRKYARQQTISFRQDAEAIHITPHTSPDKILPLIGEIA